MSKAHLTAIKRKRLSAPAKFLVDNEHLKGSILDYGCGRGDDAQHLEIDSYDPHYQPVLPSKQYDIILCTYVLNVLPQAQWRQVIEDMLEYLAPDGSIYITVRNDARSLKGVTSRGTYQTLVDLPYPVLRTNSTYRTYWYNRQFDEEFTCDWCADLLEDREIGTCQSCIDKMEEELEEFNYADEETEDTGRECYCT
ncbi:methyltransferase domain-containing protein [Candidatus Pacearchaeota archaeon]|nr:methyltransferase domain-containing protein [Candidatus Pacearchaeota archaeon]